MIYRNLHVRMTLANALSELSTLRRWCSSVGIFLLVTFPLFSQTPLIKNGVNIQASYYNRGNVTIGWDLMEDYPEIEAVRIEIEPDRVAQAVRWIREAQEEGYQVIATYHRATQLGSNKLEDLQAGTRWWLQNYRLLASNGLFIINIMNEWGGHDLTATAYADAYNEAISQLRAIYDGPLIIDLPGFGNGVQILSDAYDLITDENIIYSAHIYSGSFNVAENRWLNIADLELLSTLGDNFMVGEFCNGNNGGADWCRMIDYAYSKQWPIFGWAWNGDGRGLNMVTPSWVQEPRATNFSPTPFLEQIVAKLRGDKCFTEVFDLVNAPLCNVTNIDEACDDKNDFTINDRFNEFCVCVGTFTNTLNDAIIEESLLLFPNPAENELNIEIIKRTNVQDIKIYNYLGQLVKSLPSTNFNLTVTVDINGLPNGTYYVVLTANDKLFSEPFMKLE